MVSFITARKQGLQRLCFHRCLSVHRGGLCPDGLCLGGLCPGRSLPGGLCPVESLSRTVSVQGEGVLCPAVSVQRSLCPGESLSWGVSVQAVSVQGISVQEGLCQGDPLLTCERYASYWNAFLFRDKNYFIMNWLMQQKYQSESDT